MKAAAYMGTRNLYKQMMVAAKSLIFNSDVDKVYLLIEDDEFPYELPDIVETRNVSNQPYFDPQGPNYKSQYTYMVMMKCALFKEFPDLDRILSLDVDTIVDKDISDLWNTRMDDFYFAAVKEPAQSTERFVYTNFGVVLFNLEKLRDGKGDEMIHILNTQHHRWVEQDTSNLLCQCYICELAPEYNVNPWTNMSVTPKIKHFAGRNDWDNTELYKKHDLLTWDEIMKRRKD